MGARLRGSAWLAVAVLAVLAALVALSGCGGSASPRRNSTPRPTTCTEAIDHIEALAGDLDRGLTAGPIAGFEGLSNRRRWREACAHFSPWVRRCLLVSTVRQELSSCTPASEPWSRRHDPGRVPEEEEEEFLACVNASGNRMALSRCGYEP
jgi:hypothetical protein